MGSFGWRALFISVGVVGILFALVWWRCYREPHQDSRLSDSEREHILRGGGLAARSSSKTLLAGRWCASCWQNDR